MRGFKIRFQHWVLGATVLLVLTLSAAFLITVFRTFTTISRDNAATRFNLLARQATDELVGLLHENGKLTTAQSHADLSNFVLKGRLNPDEHVREFTAAVDDDQNIYSQFVGLGNEEFLQVIGIRADTRIAAALQAPPTAWFAVRRITLQPDGSRRDHYEFLDNRRQLLGSRTAPATLVPTQRPWYASAQKAGGLVVTDPYIFASTGEPGITVAAPLADNAGVVAADLSLRSLRDFLNGIALPANGLIMVQDARQNIMAFSGRGDRFDKIEITPLTPAAKVDLPIVELMRERFARNAPPIRLLPGNDEPFVIARHETPVYGGNYFEVTVAAPLSDFTAAFDVARRDVLIVAAIVLALLLPLAFAGSRQVARSLHLMARDSEYFKNLDFEHEPHRPDTFLYEVNALGDAQSVMYHAIQKRTGDLLVA